MQVLDDFAKETFSSLSFSEKLSILINGKLCPELKTVHKTKTKVCTCNMSTADYKTVE